MNAFTSYLLVMAAGFWLAANVIVPAMANAIGAAVGL